MFAFGECGFAAEIPAFAGMEGCVELAAAFSFISPTPIPAKAGISLPSNCKKTMRCERCSHQQTGRFPPSREWKGGGRKSESHSRDSENFPRSGTLQCSPSANAASPQRFRLSPEWKGVLSWRPLFLLFPLLPFPRKRESPYPLIVKNDAVRALLAPANREIPAFAGMERGGESRNLILATARIFREAEHCNGRLRRMRLRRRDSGFRRNGSRGGTSLFRSIPVQAKMKMGASIPKICANCYN